MFRFLIVEPTSACNLKCRMCPQREYGVGNAYMPAELYSKTLGYPYIKKLELSGWGEPFLHPQIINMAREAKARGLTVVATTNGTMRERMLGAYEAGLDHISVSLEGGTKETYESVRVGSDWKAMLHNLIALGETGKSLQVNVTLMEENKDEIVHLIYVMADMGVEHVKLRNLNLITSEYNHSQSLYHEDLSEMIYATSEAASDCGVVLSVDKANQKKSTSCRIPATTMYISAEGRVSPCCALGHHISFEDEDGKTDDIYTVFGSLHDQTLLEIWRNPRYVEFREKWVRREVPECCGHCYYRRGKE